MSRVAADMFADLTPRELRCVIANNKRIAKISTLPDLTDRAVECGKIAQDELNRRNGAGH